MAVPPVFRVFRGAMAAFVRSRAPEAAAGMAYYAFFSLFPLVLLLIAVAGRWLESAEAQGRVLDLIGQTFPLSRELVEENIRGILANRGSMSVLGIVGVIWSGMGFFAALVFNVNRAWRKQALRGAWWDNLVALVMTLASATLLAVSLLVSAAAGFVRGLAAVVPGIAPFVDSLPSIPAGGPGPWLVTFVLLYGIYRWASGRRVKWSAALPAAFVSAGLLEVTKYLFGWYVGSKLVRYELLYGGLGAIVVLLLWSYIGSTILLFGAHLSASIAHEAAGSAPGKPDRDHLHPA